MNQQIRVGIQWFQRTTACTTIAILDCASGAGDGLRGLLDEPGIELLTGVDLDLTGLQQATSQHPYLARCDWTVVNADLSQLPFSNGVFDISLFSFSFHHIEQPWRVLPSVVRVLRPVSMIMIADLVAPSDLVADEFFYALGRLRQPDNFRNRPLTVLQFWLESYGFAPRLLSQTMVAAPVEPWMNAHSSHDGNLALAWLLSAPEDIARQFHLRYDETRGVHFIDLSLIVIAGMRG